MNGHEMGEGWRMRRMPMLVAVAVLAIGALVIALGPSTGRHSPDRAKAPVPPAAGHTAPQAERTLVVVTGRHEPTPSAPGTVMHALRVSGAVPARPMPGTVMSDEDCAPDAAGVSHCANKLRLANGRMLTVRHPHRMADVACMTPGERVQVRRA